MSRKNIDMDNLSLADKVYLADRGQLPDGVEDPRKATPKGMVVVGETAEAEPTEEPTNPPAPESIDDTTDPDNTPDEDDDEDDDDELEGDDYDDMSVDELREELSGRDLAKSGNKAELIERLRADDQEG